MNKLVREHYPIEKLPEDLRPAGIGPTNVKVTVEIKFDEPRGLTATEALALIRQMQQENSERGTGVTDAEVAARMQELRDLED